MHVCLPARLPACLPCSPPACLLVCMLACLLAFLPACPPACLLVCMLACLLAFLPACLLACLAACPFVGYLLASLPGISFCFVLACAPACSSVCRPPACSFFFLFCPVMVLGVPALFGFWVSPPRPGSFSEPYKRPPVRGDLPLTPHALFSLEVCWGSFVPSTQIGHARLHYSFDWCALELRGPSRL